MLNLIFRRIAIAIPVLLLVITLTFLMVHSAPGGPFDEEKAVSDEVLVKLNERYNLDKPLLDQYFDYLSGVVLSLIHTPSPRDLSTSRMPSSA